MGRLYSSHKNFFRKRYFINVETILGYMPIHMINLKLSSMWSAIQNVTEQVNYQDKKYGFSLTLTLVTSGQMISL